MTDELRQIAEAAKNSHGWYAGGVLYDALAGFLKCGSAEEDSAFIAAASPDVVLGLLDSIAIESHCRFTGWKERDEAHAAVRRLAGALKLSLERLGLLHQFMCDAHKCDFNEDRTSSWIAFMDHDVRTFSHGPALAAMADPVVRRIVEGG